MQIICTLLQTDNYAFLPAPHCSIFYRPDALPNAQPIVSKHCGQVFQSVITPHHNRFTALFRDHPDEPVPEENFWTLWCNGRLTEADTPTIRLGATPSGLTSAHLHHPQLFTGRMPFLPPNQQCQITEGN